VLYNIILGDVTYYSRTRCIPESWRDVERRARKGIRFEEFASKDVC